MLTKLKRLFTNELKEPRDDEIEDIHSLAAASAMLLLEVAWADHEVEAREINHIKHALLDLYELDSIEVDKIIEKSRIEHAESTSVFPFAQQVNGLLELPEKRLLIKHLWLLNTFDEHDEFHYEEHIIRKIADLLYVSHNDFIALKLEAKEETANRSS